METAADEGFVQFAVTTPRDPTAPKSIRAGKSLSPGTAGASPPRARDCPSCRTTVTPIRRTPPSLHSRSRPSSRPGPEAFRACGSGAPTGSGPGWRTWPATASPTRARRRFTADVLAKTAEFTALRYEPVAPPILMLQAPPIEGKSVERLVVRTPVISGLGALTARHVAPPKASQLLAELHGKFDAGSVDGSPAGYALASRKSNSINAGAQQTKPSEDGAWFQPAAHVTVQYLPDPQARGAALTGLPNEPAPGTTPPIAFGGAWPDAQPFRIDLKAVTAAAAAPAWDPVNRVLTVELAPAQRATVRINSVLIIPGDLDSRGVWTSTKDQAPANLADVKKSLLDGQHWAHLPWRDITLLHAVQTPLAAPAITALAPSKGSATHSRSLPVALSRSTRPAPAACSCSPSGPIRSTIRPRPRQARRRRMRMSARSR